MMTLTIRLLTLADGHLHPQMADILMAGFAENWPGAFADHEDNLAEIADILSEGYIVVALAGDVVVGWAGGLPEYDGHVMELHPLVVSPAHQGKGIGWRLVAAWEDEARRRGAITALLGSDDENHMTSLAGVDLYDDLYGHIARIRNLKGHPYAFYAKLGFIIVGVVPDANGPGKPDIMMAKRLV